MKEDMQNNLQSLHRSEFINSSCLDTWKCIPPQEVGKGKNYHNGVEKYNNKPKYFHGNTTDKP